MIDFRTQKPKIMMTMEGEGEVTFKVDKYYLKDFENLGDKELIVSVKEYHKKRSMSQNAYLWVLIGELGKKLNGSKDEIYKMYIKDFGVYHIVPIKNEAVESFKNKWSKNGIGWFVEEIGKSKIDQYTNLIVYFGSSSYDSKEMAVVINSVVNDCKDQGIPTLTSDDFLKLENEND